MTDLLVEGKICSKPIDLWVNMGKHHGFLHFLPETNPLDHWESINRNRQPQSSAEALQSDAFPSTPSHRLRRCHHMAVCQNLVPLVNIKIAGKWMFIPLKMVLIGY